MMKFENTGIMFPSLICSWHHFQVAIPNSVYKVYRTFWGSYNSDYPVPTYKVASYS